MLYKLIMAIKVPNKGLKKTEAEDSTYRRQAFLGVKQ